jgi:NADPH-dependent ferric siderophore reductase
MTILKTPAALATRKVRHPLKARLLQVLRTARITPSLVRVTLTGDDLADFVSASFDDHIKIFLPAAPGEKPLMPQIGPQGSVFPEGQERPIMRDYTPRRYDPLTRELDIDFVLHGQGAAAAWAAQASPGQYLGIGGPRGSFVIPQEYDWHLLIGDETAIPAIGRRLAELPEGKRVLAVIETELPDSQLEFETRADLDVQWVRCSVDQADGTSALERVVRRLQFPDGEGFVWAAGEYSSIQNIRRYLVNERGMDKSHIRAASYWRRGAAASHEVFAE